MSVVPRDRDRLAHARRESRFLRELLPHDVGLEAPDAAAIFELRARVDAGRARPAIGNLAGIRRKSDVDVDVAGVVERDVLLARARRRPGIHRRRFRPARRLQLSGRQLEAADVRRWPRSRGIRFATRVPCRRPSPNFSLTTSALPSPFVSRSPTMPPALKGASDSAAGRAAGSRRCRRCR